MKKFLGGAAIVLFSMGTIGTVSAAPVSVGDALLTTGDGLNSRWVNTNYSPHNVDQALEAVGLDITDPRVSGVTEQIVTSIDFADGNYGGVTAAYDPIAVGMDDSFAVEYYGYINITADDTYNFRAYTDDGFRLKIGGEQTMQYYGDRAPGWSNGTVDLTAGMYEIYMVGWEQGGQFVNELSWSIGAGATDYSVIDKNVLFTTFQAVPEPATMFLFGAGLLGVAGVSLRKKQKK